MDTSTEIHHWGKDLSPFGVLGCRRFVVVISSVRKALLKIDITPLEADYHLRTIWWSLMAQGAIPPKLSYDECLRLAEKLTE